MEPSLQGAKYPPGDLCELLHTKEFKAVHKEIFQIFPKNFTQNQQFLSIQWEFRDE